MNLPRLLLAGFMAVFTVISSQPAHAVSVRPLLFAGKEAKYVYTGLTATASKSRYGGIMVHILDDAGKPLNNMFLESAGREAARAFKPSNIIKGTYIGAMKETVKRWPIETFGFFMAIGAINTAQLIFDYSKNPVVQEQHVQTQEDPVGHLGFMAFMMGNGTSSYLLNEIYGPDKMAASRFRHFAPFLGMGVGMIASNIVHEIGHFPSLKECAISLPGPEKTKACDKAYEAWLDLDFAEKGHEWAPQLISLFTSFAISGVTTWAASSILRVVGVQVALLFTPGGIYAKGFKAAMWFVNMTMFTGIDVLIRDAIMTPYNNWHKANLLEEAETTLYKELVEQKKNGWKSKGLLPHCYDTKEKPVNLATIREELKDYTSGENCKRDFNGTIFKTRDLLQKWRAFNLEPVAMAHQNWQQHLTQMSSMYGGAKDFYKYFLNEVWEKYYGQYSIYNGQDKSYVYPMDRTYPLFGIKPLNFDQEHKKAFLNDPTSISEMQISAVTRLVMALKEQQDKILPTLNSAAQKKFLAVLEDLGKQDAELIGKTIQKMKVTVYQASTLSNRLKEKVAQVNDIDSAANLAYLYQGMLDSLGKPLPLLAPGEGFTYNYNLHPELGANLANVPFPKNYGTLQTDNMAKSMLAAMIFGPDAEDGTNTVVGVPTGFKATFLPPRIRADDSSFSPTMPPQNVERQNLKFDFFKMHVTSGSGSNLKIYNSILDYLSQGHIRTSVVNKDPQSINKWWSKYPEKDFHNAILDYEDKYQDIIVQLQERMWRKNLSFWGFGEGFWKNRMNELLSIGPASVMAGWNSLKDWAKGPTASGFTKEDGDSSFNNGPVSNGIMESFDQEKKMYLLIMGEMYKDLYTKQHDTTKLMTGTAYANSFDTKTIDAPYLSAEYMQSSTLPILRALRYSDNLQLATIASSFKNVPNKDVLGKVEFSNLRWQKDVMSAFDEITALMKKIKNRAVRDNTGKFITVSTSYVSNAEITAAKDKAIKVLDQIEKGILNNIQVSWYQKTILSECFNGLDQILNEMVALGQIANAVSYTEVINSQNGTMAMSCEKVKQVIYVAGQRKMIETCK